MNRILAAVVVVLLTLFTGVNAHAAPGDPPPGTPPGSRIWAKYVELGGDSLLGAPTSGEFCGLIDGGCGMRFERGLILWSLPTDAHFLRGSILEHYAANQYEAGHLGYPTSDEQCWIRGGCFQTFTGGSIYWSPTTGAHFVKGAIRDRWAAEGWEAGHLGYPTSVEFCGLRAAGCFQRFQGGSIYWSPGTGAHFVKGAIRDRWGSLGWESLRTPAGPPQGITEIWRARWGHDLGYPTSGEFCGLIRRGCFQNFERGRIYFSPATGAHPVTPSANGGYWTYAGAERSRFGYPVEEEHCVGYPQSEWMCLQRFENGEELNDYPGHFDDDGNRLWAW